MKRDNQLGQLIGRQEGLEPKIQLETDKLPNVEACDLELQRIQVKQRAEGLEGVKQDRNQRKEFAQLIFRLLCCYLLAVGGFICLSACEAVAFKISDGVLLTLLGTTTANIIAIFRFVARYLFK